MRDCGGQNRERSRGGKNLHTTGAQGSKQFSVISIKPTETSMRFCVRPHGGLPSEPSALIHRLRLTEFIGKGGVFSCIGEGRWTVTLATPRTHKAPRNMELMVTFAHSTSPLALPIVRPNKVAPLGGFKLFKTLTATSAGPTSAPPV